MCGCPARVRTLRNRRRRRRCVHCFFLCFVSCLSGVVICPLVFSFVSAPQPTRPASHPATQPHAYPWTHGPMCPCAHVPKHPCTHAPMHPCTHAPMHPCTRAHIVLTVCLLACCLQTHVCWCGQWPHCVPMAPQASVVTALPQDPAPAPTPVLVSLAVCPSSCAPWWDLPGRLSRVCDGLRVVRYWRRRRTVALSCCTCSSQGR